MKDCKYDALRRRIRNEGISQGAAAEALGIDPASMSRKMQGRQPIYLDEAVKLAVLLNVETVDEFCGLFFPEAWDRPGRA